MLWNIIIIIMLILYRYWELLIDAILARILKWSERGRPKRLSTLYLLHSSPWAMLIYVRPGQLTFDAMHTFSSDYYHRYYYSIEFIERAHEASSQHRLAPIKAMNTKQFDEEIKLYVQRILYILSCWARCPIKGRIQCCKKHEHTFSQLQMHQSVKYTPIRTVRSVLNSESQIILRRMFDTLKQLERTLCCEYSLRIRRITTKNRLFSKLLRQSDSFFRNSI